MVGGGVLYAAAFAVLAVVGNPSLAVVGVLFFLGGALALAYTVVEERHGPATSGVSIRAVNTLAFLGPALLPTAMGGILDAYWTGETVAGARVYTLVGYRVAFGPTAAVLAVAVVGSLWLHLRIER